MRVANAIFTPNAVLVSTPQSEEALLRPHLSRSRLVGGQVLIEHGQAAEHVYFIESGVALLVAQSTESSLGVQVAMIGREGLIGALAVIGAGSPAFGKVVVQIPGMALRIPVASLSHCLENMPALKALCHSWVVSLSRQIMMAAASNATEPVMARCARWLLMAHERVDGNDLPVTHEALAGVLGVRRAGVTTAVMALQQAGLISVGRGRIRIIARAALERFARHGVLDGAPPLRTAIPPQQPAADQADLSALAPVGDLAVVGRPT